MVLISVTCGVTSCARSLSPVEISTGGRWPRRHAGQRADGVVGLDARHLQHRPAQQAHHLVDGRDLLRSGSGIGARCALYSGYQASRKVGPLASNTQAACAAG
jgi:hypothetical protein